MARQFMVEIRMVEWSQWSNSLHPFTHCHVCSTQSLVLPFYTCFGARQVHQRKKRPYLMVVSYTILHFHTLTQSFPFFVASDGRGLKAGVQRHGNSLFGATKPIAASDLGNLFQELVNSKGSITVLLDSLIGKGSALYEGVEEFMVRSMDGKLEFPYSFELVVPKGGEEKVQERVELNLECIRKCSACHAKSIQCIIDSCEECLSNKQLCAP